MVRQGKVAAAAAAVVALALTGCAPVRVVGSGGAAVDSRDLGESSVSCTEPNSMTHDPGEPVPAGFVPVAATRCVLRIAAVAGDGEWMMLEEQRAEGDLSELVAQLRTPTKTLAPDDNTICLGIGYPPYVITLVDGTGRSIVPAIPRTPCLAPMASVIVAIQALPWQLVRTSNLRQVRTQLEISSGCAGDFKPVLDLAAADSGGRAATGPVFPQRPPMLQVCHYQPGTEQFELAGGKQFGVGTLTGATTLRDADLTRTLEALNGAPPITSACAQPQAPFAVLSPPGGGLWVAVELGGCHRMVDDDNRLRQLDPAFTLPG